MAASQYNIDFNIKGLEKLKTYQDKLTKASKRVKELTAAQKKREAAGRTDTKVYQRQAKTLDNYKNKVLSANASIDSQTKKLQANARQMASNTKSTSKAASGAKKAGASMAAMGLSVAGVAMALRRLSTFLVSSVKDFAAFEKGVKNVTTLMSQDETNLLSPKLYEGVLDLSKEFGFKLDDINKAMFNSVSAGIKGGEALEFLGVASKLAMAGVTDLKSATMGLTTVLNAYNMETSEAQKVSEILFTTQKFGVTTVEELSKSLGVVVPFAAASGISLEELGAAIATTTRSGLDAAKTVTALRAAISQMQKPAAESRDLFLEYGIPIGAAEMKAVGFTETLKRLNKVYQESPEIIEQMFGNVRGLTAIFSLAGENADQFEEILAKTSDEIERAGNLTKGTNDLLNTMDTRLNQLSASWTDFKVALGDSEFFKELVREMSQSLDILGSDYLSFFDKMNPFLSQDSTHRLHEVRKAADEANTALEKMRDVIESGEDVSIMGMLGTPDGVPEEEMARVKEVIGFARTAQVEVEKAAASGIKMGVDYSDLISDYDEYLEGIGAATDAQNLDDEEADKRKTELKRQYNELELSERKKLSAEIEKISKEGVEKDQFQSVTSLQVAKAKYESLRVLEEEYKENNNASAAEMTRVTEAMSKLRIDIQKKELRIASQNSKPYNDEKLRMEETLARKKREILEKQFSDDESIRISEVEAKQQIFDLELKHFEDLMTIGTEDDEIRKSSPEEQARVFEEIQKRKVQVLKNTFDEEIRIEGVKQELKMQGLQAAADFASQLSEMGFSNFMRRQDKEKEALKQKLDDGRISQKQYDKDLEAIERKAFERKKKQEQASATIAYLMELANIAVQAAANKANAWTWGIAGLKQYAALAAIASARFVGTTATIASQKFADGGMVYGNSHSQGGKKFAVGGRVVELEGGEAVINRRSSSMFRNELSAMNVAGGGVDFSRGVPNFNTIDYNLLAQAIGENTHVVLPVESLNQVQNRVKAIEDGSKF